MGSSKSSGQCNLLSLRGCTDRQQLLQPLPSSSQLARLTLPLFTEHLLQQDAVEGQLPEPASAQRSVQLLRSVPRILRHCPVRGALVHMQHLQMEGHLWCIVALSALLLVNGR